MIIDVDAHAEPAKDWLDDSPHLKDALAGRFPESDPRVFIEPRTPADKVESAMYGLAGNVQRLLPADTRLPAQSLAAPFHIVAHSPEKPEGFIYEGAEQFQPLDPVKRLAWMNENGVAVQNLITAKGISLARDIEDPRLGREAVSYLNTWMTERLDGYTDRQKLVASVRFEDLDWAVRELTRMRERGCRTFMIPGEPVDMTPPYDPSYDRVWAAACDLGMVAMLHIGSAPALLHPGWGRTDRAQMVRYLASSSFFMNAHLMLNALVFGGVFERHPTLTLVISEFGVGWLPFTLSNMDARASKGGERIHGPYELPLKPSEYVMRNVRVSPLPGQLPPDYLENLPGVAVFCSDYPHFEGNPAPLEYYETVLSRASQAVKDQFLGGSMLDAYEAMGDPLV